MSCARIYAARSAAAAIVIASVVVGSVVGAGASGAVAQRPAAPTKVTGTVESGSTVLLLGGGGSALCATEESDMLIFTGNANAELATEIAALLGAQLGAITVSRFASVRGVDGGGGKGLLALGEPSKGCAFISPPRIPSPSDGEVNVQVHDNVCVRAAGAHPTASRSYPRVSWTAPKATASGRPT